MLITEKELRKLIRKELSRPSKYDQVNEIAISGPASGAIALGAGAAISKLKKVFKNRSLRKLTVDFIKKSPQMFGAQQTEKISTMSLRITEGDVKDWTEQSPQLKHFGDKMFGIINRSRLKKAKSSNKIFSSNLMYSSIKTFDSSKARKVFIEDEGFEFDDEDKRYLSKIWRIVHRSKSNYNDENAKFQFIDTMFYLMVTLYNKKYSSEASSARLEAEKDLSRILGIQIRLAGKNSWENQDDYERSLKRGSDQGPGRGMLSIPDNIARGLDVDKLAKIAEVYIKHKNNLSTRLYIPWQFQNKIGSITDIESDIRSLKHKFKFFREVCGVCFTFMAPGASKTIPLFLKALSKAVAGDQAMEVVIDKLIKRIENSRLREGKLKEVIKLVISVALNAVV